MSKFKIGDIVKATKESNKAYAVTNEKNHFVGEIISNYELAYGFNRCIALLAGEGTTEMTLVKDLNTSNIFWVSDKYFELAYPEVEQNEKKNNSCQKSPQGNGYLQNNETQKFLGKIGKSTRYKDNKGNELFIGDIVHIIKLIDGDEFYMTTKAVVVEDNEGQFLWGYRRYLQEVKKSGELDLDDCSVEKIRSYQDVKNGEVIRGVKYIKESKNDSERNSKKG